MMLSNSAIRRLLYITSFMVLMVGLLGLMGWIFQIPVLLQLLPGLVPMAFNTALCFFLIGLSFIVERKTAYLGFVINATVMLVAFVSLLQYILNMSWGLDRWFFSSSFELQGYATPGRMAPNTALCFFLVSSNHLLLIKKHNVGRGRRVLAESGAFLTMLISVVALIGYLVGAEPVYGWAGLTRMALLTAIGCAIMGFSLLLRTWTHGVIRVSAIPTWYIIAIFAAIFVLDLYTLDLKMRIAYIPVVFFSLFVSSRRFPFVLAAIATALSVATSLIFEFISIKEAFDEIILIIAIWLTAYMVYMQKRIQVSEQFWKKMDKQKNDFLAVLGHELRNPLASVSGALQMIKLDPANFSSMLPILDRSTAQIQVLLDDLLDMNRITRGKFSLHRKVVNVAEIIRKVSDGVRTEFDNKKQNYEVIIYNQNLWVNGDPVRIEQIISNLLTNSRKYTLEGGTILLEAGLEAGQVYIKVTDNGIGILSDNLEQIFMPFIQINKNQGVSGGLGIGLALVKSLVEMHEGEILAESEGEGKGARFTVYLPLETSVENPQAASENRNPKIPVGLSFLLVDDNPDALLGLRALLSSQGSTFKEMNDPVEAIKVAGTMEPDVCLLDIGMPGMDGYTLIKHLKSQQKKKTLYVAISGYGHTAAHARSLEAGFHHHLNKPVSYEELTYILQQAWQSDYFATQVT